MSTALKTAVLKRITKLFYISLEKLFELFLLVDIPGAGTFEAYMNRDALPYKAMYVIEAVASVYRGTLRNVGHCETWNYFKKIGFIVFAFSNMGNEQVMARLLDSKVGDLPRVVAKKLGIPEYSVTIKKMAWLGLFSHERVGLGKTSVFDMFAKILQHKLSYYRGRGRSITPTSPIYRCLPGGSREKITIIMVDTRIPGGDFSWPARLSLPAAIATRLLCEGKIDLRGVYIPVHKQIYQPVLKELAAMNIRLPV